MITIELIQSINYALALGGLVGLVLIPVIVYDLCHRRLLQKSVSQFGLLFSFLTTLSASILTLIYSEIFGIIPCGLCWLERVALYPQILMLLVAVYFKDKSVARYGIVLSAFGLFVSLYHHYIQMGGTQFIKCPAAGEGIDCAKRFFFEFGFMTFPFMSVILFVFLIVIYMYILKTKQTNSLM